MTNEKRIYIMKFKEVLAKLSVISKKVICFLLWAVMLLAVTARVVVDVCINLIVGAYNSVNSGLGDRSLDQTEGLLCRIRTGFKDKCRDLEMHSYAEPDTMILLGTQITAFSFTTLAAALALMPQEGEHNGYLALMAISAGTFSIVGVILLNAGLVKKRRNETEK